MKTTSVDLVEELTKRNVHGKFDAIIERAKNNGYHDFKFDSNPLYADCMCPKSELYEQLSDFPELADIANDVFNGVYDESADEQDKETMRNWLEPDGEKGERLIEVLGLGKTKKTKE